GTRSSVEILDLSLDNGDNSKRHLPLVVLWFGYMGLPGRDLGRVVDRAAERERAGPEGHLSITYSIFDTRLRACLQIAEVAPRVGQPTTAIGPSSVRNSARGRPDSQPECCQRESVAVTLRPIG